MKHKTGDRFKKVADELFNGNISEMARAMDMTPQSFNKYAQGDTLPGGVILKRVIEIGVNLNWLLAGIPPMLISEMKDAGINKLFHAERKDLDKGDSGKKGDQANHQPSPDFFAHINEENLTETELSLLEEAKRFSRDLEKWQIPPQVKLLMLELMIEHIGQEIERLRSSRR